MEDRVHRTLGRGRHRESRWDLPCLAEPGRRVRGRARVLQVRHDGRDPGPRRRADPGPLRRRRGGRGRRRAVRGENRKAGGGAAGPAGRGAATGRVDRAGAGGAGL
jgi:hypothetical protein